MDRKTSAFIQDNQIDLPKYSPSDHELLHISYLYRRLDEMKQHVEDLGLYDEWEDAEKYFINDQIASKKTELPTINLGTEIEIIETKTSEETKVLPEVILKPVHEEDIEKVEALQKVIEYVKEKNLDDLLKSKMLKQKNIYGVAFQKIHWKEVWRDVKLITGSDEGNSEFIKNLKWKTESVLKYRDVSIENIPPQHLLFSEESKTIEDANEVIQVFYYKDINKCREEFGKFRNFKYVSKDSFDLEVEKVLKERHIEFRQEDIDVMGFYYWNIAKDEYSIVVNGVLLTQYGENGGNPIPNMYWKDIPFVRASCRFMPGGREFYPKGDVALIKRTKECKNTLVNAIKRAVHTNSKSALLASKELAKELEKLGFNWEDANVLPVKTKDEASMVRPLTIQSDISGAMALLNKLDEYQTIMLGVDTHSLLSSVQETATKTAVRAETAMKRIADGLKLVEHEALVRKTKIIIALLRQYYKETEDFLDVKDIGKGETKKVTIKKTIPVDDVKFFWTKEYQPVSMDELNQIEGLTPEFLSSIFYTDDGKTFEFLVENEDELKQVKSFRLLPDDTQKKIFTFLRAKEYNRLRKEGSEGETSQLEIKKELFETEFEIKIIPRGTASYSDLYEREKSDAMLERFIGNPFINQNELIKQNIEANGINSDKLIKDEKQVAEEQEKALLAEQQEQGQDQGQELQQALNQAKNVGESE